MEETLKKIYATLESTPALWQAIIEHIPYDLLTRRPLETEWSALECLEHMIQTERDVFPSRLRLLRDGVEHLPAFNASLDQHRDQESYTPAEMINAFRDFRTKSIELLAGIDVSVFNRSSQHEELGPVTLGEFLHEWAAHDLMHTVQAMQAIMQPFIKDSGAWKPYFAKHWINE